MTSEGIFRDLVCLVADKNQEQSLRGLFSRPEALDTSLFTFDLFVHPESDPGCCQQSHDFLRPFDRRYRHALVVFDFEGCGETQTEFSEVERRIERQLGRNGWDDRARVVIVEPELEAWVWSPSPEVDRILGWFGRLPDLRSWLIQQGLLPEGRH